MNVYSRNYSRIVCKQCCTCTGSGFLRTSGSNPRYVHTYTDEDGMRWVKGNLDSFKLSGPMHVGWCGVGRWFGVGYFIWISPYVLAWAWGIMARGHPRMRHFWLLRCTKLRPYEGHWLICFVFYVLFCLMFWMRSTGCNILQWFIHSLVTGSEPWNIVISEKRDLA